jgi:hypothetical protein
MAVFKPLRLALFCYEVVRLVEILRNIPLSTGNDMFLRTLLWAAPNALFPLMALFLLLRPNTFSAYIPLHVAGKLIAVVISLRLIIGGFPFIIERMERLYPLLVLGDMFSIAASLVLRRQLRRLKEVERVEKKGGTGCE